MSFSAAPINTLDVKKWAVSSHSWSQWDHGGWGDGDQFGAWLELGFEEDLGVSFLQQPITERCNAQQNFIVILKRSVDGINTTR